MSGGAWELIISGFALAASCLRIHTNKGQWESRNGADKACLSISAYLHLSVASRPPAVVAAPHTLTHFSLCMFLTQSWPPSFSLSPADLCSRLGSQNTSKQLLSNGPLFKQSVERPDEDDWSLTSSSMHSYESLDQPGWREKERLADRGGERDRETYWRIGKAVCTTRPGIYLMSRLADNL